MLFYRGMHVPGRGAAVVHFPLELPQFVAHLHDGFQEGTKVTRVPSRRRGSSFAGRSFVRSFLSPVADACIEGDGLGGPRPRWYSCSKGGIRE